MRNAVLVDGLRTPFTRASNPIPGLTATELGAVPAQTLIAKYGFIPDLVIGANIGNQILHPDCSNIARSIALKSGIPKHVGAFTENVNCASGLHAVVSAADKIALGTANCVLVVAVEVMSDYAAVYSRKQREEFEKLHRFSRKNRLWRSASQRLKIATMPHDPQWLINLGLVDPMTGLRMDQSADLLAKEYGVSRYEQDVFALRSHKKARAAQLNGRLAEEIVPYKGISQDNGVRQDQTYEQLYALKPRYKNGTVTVGNASQLTDGACALLIAEENYAVSRGWDTLARIRNDYWALVGCDPKYFGLGPVYAINKVLKISGRTITDFDIIETNEAFAAVVLAQMKAFENWPAARTNINGGAIALGHPLAASGARLILSCGKEMRRHQKKRGLVTLCIGGGQGEALILENPD